MASPQFSRRLGQITAAALVIIVLASLLITFFQWLSRAL
jgi:hypothetical protein